MKDAKWLLKLTMLNLLKNGDKSENPSQIFNMPTGKKLDSMLDKLSAKDIKEIRAQFELDVQKENQKERH